MYQFVVSPCAFLTNHFHFETVAARSSSPLWKILRICLEIAGISVPNNCAICACVSHTLSSSIPTSKRVSPSASGMIISPLSIRTNIEKSACISKVFAFGFIARNRYLCTVVQGDTAAAQAKAGRAGARPCKMTVGDGNKSIENRCKPLIYMGLQMCRSTFIRVEVSWRLFVDTMLQISILS